MTLGVIFDLYGTLLQRPSSGALRRVARLADDPRRALRVALTTRCDTLRDYAEQLGVEVPADIELLETKLRNELDQVRVYDDVVSTMQQLKRQQIRIGLISNLASPYKKPLVDLQLATYFDATVLSCDCGLMKPSAEIYRLCLARLGLEAPSVVMVGDSLEADVEGPRRVGIAGIHLTRGRAATASAIESLTQVVQRCASPF